MLFDEEAKVNLGTKLLVPDINTELFYQIDDKLILFPLHGKNISFFRLLGEAFQKEEEHVLDLNQFFYTIAVNYSLHALNSKVLGKWVKKIFYKNNGYQTPIVLNPYRDKGMIDINNEEYLIRSRLISNVLGKISRRRTQKRQSQEYHKR